MGVFKAKYRKVKKLLKNSSSFSNQQLVAFVLFFAIVGGIFLWRSFAASSLIAKLEAEQMGIPAGASVINDSSASAGQAVQLKQNGSLEGTVTTTGAVNSLNLIMRASKCQGWPKYILSVDGSQKLSGNVTSTSWSTYSLSVSLNAGSHKFNVAVTNANSTRCQRNLFVDVINLYGQDVVVLQPTLTLSASPTSVTAGGSSTLTWQSANTSSCSASGGWSGFLATSGSSSTGALNQTTTYSMTCTGSSGTVSSSTTVSVSSVSPPPPSPSGFCVSCIKIRVDRPLIARGPSTDVDERFNEIHLSNGQYRGFAANGTTYAITGNSPWSMSDPGVAVLSPGPAGTYNSCGQYLSDTEKAGGAVYGFIHSETACNFSNGVLQTHKSEAFGTSSDEGLHWSVQGQIITGTDSPTTGKVTGEGDCTVINGQDNYYYAYCRRQYDGQTIVARAPTSSPGPGNWKKYYSGSWTQPGLGGSDTGLGSYGPTVGRWTDYNSVLALDTDASLSGLKLAFSTDKVSFTKVGEPLLAIDSINWNRPAPVELVAYPSVMNYTDANNEVSNKFLLVYMYLQPNEDFDKRYLVFRDVTMTMGTSTVTPQVGVALARWYNSGNSDRWSTTAPVPGNFSSYNYEGTFGYLMTKPDPTKATNKLDDCVSYWPGHPDHLLTFSGGCSGTSYTKLRTAGWVYQSSQTNTVPVYRCYSSSQNNHFASNQSNCEGLGTNEALLGYALAS